MMDRSTADANDPGGWLAVANTHRDFCSIAGDDPDQIHYCYWFIGWHRAYISVTERKIRAISGDDSFSYPYWNWSSDRHIPAAFTTPGSSLANAVRYEPPRFRRRGSKQRHQGGSRAALAASRAQTRLASTAITGSKARRTDQSTFMSAASAAGAMPET